MSKLKIILCTFAIFIISAVGCFADSVSSKAMGIDDKTYYLDYGSVCYTFNSFKDGKMIDVTSYSLISAKWVKDYDYSESSVPNVKYARKTNSFDLYEYFGRLSSMAFDGIIPEQKPDGGDDEQVPPVIAPMVVEEILPRFLEQLKNYLPTCITILALLLGVSLVPRIIHLLM